MRTDSMNLSKEAHAASRMELVLLEALHGAKKI